MVNKNNFQRRFLGQAVISVIFITLLLIGVVIFLFYSLRISPELKWEKMTERTKKAAEKIGPELPKDEPTFIVKYDPVLQMFDVEVKASTWEEYARIRREATFFREQGLDPCKLYIAWVAPKELIETPMPKDLDFGCPKP